MSGVGVIRVSEASVVPVVKRVKLDPNDVRERRERRLFSPHRVVLVDCDIISRGLAPRERGATVFHQLFAEIVLVESSGVPVTELLVKDKSCERLVRVTYWSSLPPPSFLVAGTVFHFVGICDNYLPSEGVEPQFVCHWMSLASLFIITQTHTLMSFT